MENIDNILDLFPSKDMNDKLNDIISIINDISTKRPIVGFHHSFYIPGWIGFIQTMIVERNMNKFANTEYCRNMNYYEFGDWIINTSKEIAEIHKGTISDNIELAKSQNDAIIRIFEVLTALWINYLPEISTYHSIEYSDNTLISPAAMVYKGVKENLIALGYVNYNERENASRSNFKNDVKGYLYGIAGYFINIILLITILGLLGTIFS